MAAMASGRWTVTDRALAVGVALGAALPRALLRGRGVLDIDSMVLALGVRSYDFASYHPHPPYHPLTIAAAKVLAPFVGPAAALTWVSVVAVGVLGAAVFGIGRELGGRAVGTYAGLLVALSPLLTANAGVALSYTNEPAALAVVALLALRARRRRDPRSWLLLGVAASVAVGVRPSAAVTAAPLVLWATGRDVPALGRAVAAGAAATAAWLVPTVVAGGGWSDFRFGTSFQTRHYVLHDPVWVGGAAAVHNNLAWLAHHVRAESPFLVAVAALAAIAALPLALDRRPGHASLLLVWAAPTLLFYGLVYGGWPLFHSGYALGLLGPAFVAAPLALRRLWGAIVARAPGRPAQTAAAIVLAAVTAMPMAWAGSWDGAVGPRREVDAWAASYEGLEEVLPPERTALLGGYAAHWALLEHPSHLVWVLELAIEPDGTFRFQLGEARGPAYAVPYFDNVRDGPDARHVIPDWVQEIAIVTGHPDEVPLPLNVTASREVVLPGGARVLVLDARALADVEQAIIGFDEARAPSRDRVWPPR